MIKKLLVILCTVLFYTTTLLASNRINITRGSIEPISISFNDLLHSNNTANKIGYDIIQVTMSDLTGSGLFKTVNSAAFIDKIVGLKNIPEFASWRQINSSLVFAGEITELEPNKFKLEYKLWDSFSHKLLSANYYIFSANQWRKVSHKIADSIYTSVTGETGYFNTKIAFVTEHGDPFKKTKRIAIMDQDGANIRYLTDGKNLVLTPRFSPDGKKIIYLSFETKIPTVYVYDLLKASHYPIGHFPGMSFAPKFSPDGRYAIMSVAKDGATDIYKYDLSSKNQQKITKGPYIDTSPSFSPDAKKITFSSDRNGRSQLFVMEANGEDQKRISFGEGSYFTPAWSPRGDFIAFTKILRGQFHIGVMRPDGSGERILTEGYMVEGPAWSPNGRVIIFTKGENNSRARLGKSRLQTIDITGHYEKEIILPVESSDPFWSNLSD
jgi:TolB protein